MENIQRKRIIKHNGTNVIVIVISIQESYYLFIMQPREINIAK